MIRKYIIFLLAIVFFTFVAFQRQIWNFLGEKAFLSWHQNKIAIHILESNRSKDFYTYFLLGRLYFVENNLPVSIDNYNKAITLNPDFKEAYYGRGLSYGFYSNLFLTDAENDFKKYIELENQEFEKTGTHAYGAWAGYNDLSWIYFIQGDFAASEEIARAGLQISNSNPWLANMLGASLLEQGKCQEAIPYLHDADNLMEKLNPNKFGEAYSGDSKEFWLRGKSEMEETIKTNLALCKK